MRRPPNLMKTTTAREPARAPADLAPPSNYLDLYGLSKPPFGGATDSSGYILFGSHRRAFELLIDHMMNRRGLVVLKGEVGVGKTETLRSAAAVAGESGLRTIMVPRPPDGRISLEQLTASLDGQPETFHNSPRKALLVDDFDLLPNDCISLLLSLARQQPDEAGGSAIVLSSSATELARADTAELAGLARDTIRLLRLGPAEVRQYIERSLWVAGGTTRRLITPEAIKLITTRSDGLPGTINRVMEAALTAGFARGDVMVTVKTVESVVGPPPPRQRPRPSKRELPHVTERAVQVVAGGLLVMGVMVFLYKGLTGVSENRSPVPRNPVAAITQTQTQLPRPVKPADKSTPLDTMKPADTSIPLDTVKPVDTSKPLETIPPALMAALMKRGTESLDLGDIAAARLLFQRAAEGGNAAAATALGKTYDPSFTPTATPEDAGHAFEWYMKAVVLGDSSASDLLKRLVAR